MHFVFILLNLESQDLRKYFEYITPVAAGAGLVLVAQSMVATFAAARALQSHARARIHPVLVAALLDIALLVVLALLMHQGAVNQ